MQSGGRADESSPSSRPTSAMLGADTSSSSLAPSGFVDPALAEIVDEITRRFQTGEEVDLDEYARRHPEWASVLQSLLSPLACVAQFSRTAISPPSSVPFAGLGRPPSNVRRLHHPPRGRPGWDGHRLRGRANFA